MTVRANYNWVPGKRERLALRADGDGWWRAEVADRLVGRVRVGQAWGSLASTSIMWTERYAPPLRTCTDLGHAVAWSGPPVAHDGVRPLRHHNHLAANPGCPGSSGERPRRWRPSRHGRPPLSAKIGLLIRWCLAPPRAVAGNLRQERRRDRPSRRIIRAHSEDTVRGLSDGSGQLFGQQLPPRAAKCRPLGPTSDRKTAPQATSGHPDRDLRTRFETVRFGHSRIPPGGDSSTSVA
jgi:hypothetical protein